MDTDMGHQLRAVLCPVRQSPLGYYNSRVNIFNVVLWIIETLL